MTKEQEDLAKRIIDGETPVCLHILGQSLVNELCAIIKAQDSFITDLLIDRDNN